MTTNVKEAKIISGVLGNEFETHEQLKKELIRRSAILDFLALYQEAKKDKVVERVKHIIHAQDFLEFKEQYMELYLTRLLGRCLRAHCTGPQAVEKERNNFRYDIDLGRTHPQYRQIFEMQKLVTLGWPWRLNTWYGYGRRHQRNERYNNNPQTYWRTRGLIDPIEVDALYAVWNQFKARVDTLQRINMDQRLTVNYGNPGFIGRNRWYRSYNNPSYHAYEAYRDFKRWMALADEFLENDHAFETFRILETHDQNSDDDIENMLQENEERQLEFLRERARDLAAQRRAENSIDFPGVDEDELEEVEYLPQEVEEGTTGQTLADRLFATLRQKGLVE